jgi:hypothetical protein
MRSRENATGDFKRQMTRVGRKRTESSNKTTQPLALECPVRDQGAKRKGKRHIYSQRCRHRYRLASLPPPMISGCSEFAKVDSGAFAAA